MPLFDLDGKRVTKIPFAKDYVTFQKRLSEDERRAISDWINARIDGDDIHTAGWMPGRNWNGSVLQPIFERAARKNYDAAAKCFGLMVYVAFMDRPESEEWFSARFELNGRDIGSRTYFRKR